MVMNSTKKDASGLNEPVGASAVVRLRYEAPTLVRASLGQVIAGSGGSKFDSAQFNNTYRPG